MDVLNTELKQRREETDSIKLTLDKELNKQQPNVKEITEARVR